MWPRWADAGCVRALRLSTRPCSLALTGNTAHKIDAATVCGFTGEGNTMQRTGKQLDGGTRPPTVSTCLRSSWLVLIGVAAMAAGCVGGGPSSGATTGTGGPSAGGTGGRPSEPTPEPTPEKALSCAVTCDAALTS